MARKYRTGENPRDPYLYLLAAVLHRALLDARSRRIGIRMAALDWLRECAVDTCEVLGISIEDWRELL